MKMYDRSTTSLNCQLHLDEKTHDFVPVLNSSAQDTFNTDATNYVFKYKITIPLLNIRPPLKKFRVSDSTLHDSTSKLNLESAQGNCQNASRSHASKSILFSPVEAAILSVSAENNNPWLVPTCNSRTSGFLE